MTDRQLAEKLAEALEAFLELESRVSEAYKASGDMAAYEPNEDGIIPVKVAYEKMEETRDKACTLAQQSLAAFREAGEPRKWCAWCGVYGDHQSGNCKDLARHTKEMIETQGKCEACTGRGWMPIPEGSAVCEKCEGRGEA